jgi:multiple sugar transport system permease protein
VLLFLSRLGPSLAVILLSLADWQLGARTFRVVGLANYAHMLGDRVFWRSLANTLVYVGVVMPVSVGLGLALAILLESGTSLRTFYRGTRVRDLASTRPPSN